MSIPIGRDFQLSIEDQDGRFVVLGPEPQRSEVERFLAEHPEIEQQAIAQERAQRMAVIVGGPSFFPFDGASLMQGSRGDRIVIDDPWGDSGEPIDLEAARRLFTDRLPALPDSIDPVIIMSRPHDPIDDIRAAKAEVEARLWGREYQSKPRRPSDDAPRNRTERRAQDARARKGRR